MKRADARRNEETLLTAAAAAFVEHGVDAPVRDIAARAGVGLGTIYRHFPTRADLIVAVYKHQVEACAEAGPVLLARGPSPHAALAAWIDLFVDFLVTKHGLADHTALHDYFLDRLVPVCGDLIEAAFDPTRGHEPCQSSPRPPIPSPRGVRDATSWTLPSAVVSVT